MPRKRSITRVWLIPIELFLVFVAVTEAQPSFRSIEREQEDREDAITSGIRKLEDIRRGIVESSRRGPPHDNNSRDHLPMEGHRINSGRSRYSSATAGTRGENSSAFKPREVRQPRRQVDAAMYEALSKLANIQIADPRVRDSPRSITSQDRSAGRFTSNSQNFDDSVDVERTKDAVTNSGLSKTLKNEATTEKTSTPTSKLQFAPRKFHCHPIREIYIPKVEKKMPAYACSLGRRAFVISSERFIQDSRDYFEVNVDESTYRRLTPMTSGMTTLTSGVSVLPATLVLRQGEDGYTVRGVNANRMEAQATATGDN